MTLYLILIATSIAVGLVALLLARRPLSERTAFLAGALANALALALTLVYRNRRRP